MSRRAKIKATSFVQSLSEISLPSVFNPYRDECMIADNRGAAKLRCENLIEVVSAGIESEIQELWIGRDLGYLGGRRTGIALTDEAHLEQATRYWGTQSLRKSTSGEAVHERTAAYIWEAIQGRTHMIHLWNVFPFHPHEKSDTMTNRTHTSKERGVGIAFMLLMVDLIKPKRIIAIGRDAERAVVQNTSLEFMSVRHPSYGGQTVFRKQVRDLI